MAFEKEDKTQAALRETIHNLQKQAVSFWTQPDMRVKTKEYADVLGNEMKTFLTLPSPEALDILSMLYDDLGGDLLVKAFNLRVLVSLVNRYDTHNGFQWFINSTYPMFEMTTIQNPFLLRVNMFINIFDKHVDTPLAKEARNRVLTLSGSEESFRQTTEATDLGVVYLLHRPWLISYLLALKFYRFHYNLGELGNQILKLRDEVRIKQEDAKAVEEAAKEAMKPKNPASENISIPFPVGPDFPGLNPLP